MDTSSSITTALNVGRIAFGLAALVAPGQVGRGWIGRAAEPAAAHVMVRAFAIRDIALGAATIGTIRATGPAGTGAKVLVGLGVMVDATDAVSGVLARDEVPSLAGILAIAGGAAVAGAAALRLAEAGAEA